MSGPKVLNKRDAAPSADNVYVGRPSKWGNPFSHQPGTLARFRVSTRSRAIAAFVKYVAEDAQGRSLAEDAKRELRGKNLVCWCAPLPCHADELLRIANER